MATKIGTDTNTTHASPTVLDFSFSHTLVSGLNRMIVVAVGGETTLADSSPIWYASSITYGSQPMTNAVLAQTTEVTGSNNSSSIWYILEEDLPSDGLQTIQITGAGATAPIELFAVCAEYSGVFQGIPEFTASTIINAPAPSDTISTSITTNKRSWVISAYCCGNQGSWTVAESQVEIYDNSQLVDPNGGTTFGVCELRGAVGNETSFSSTYVTGANRLTRVSISIGEPPWKINTTQRYTVEEVNTITRPTINNINTYIT